MSLPIVSLPIVLVVWPLSLSLPTRCTATNRPRYQPLYRTPQTTPRALAHEPSKFVRHAQLEPGCAPLGVVTAGLDERQLDALAAAVDDLWTPEGESPPNVPIAVLGAADLRRGTRLRDVLAQLGARDCVIPTQPAEVRPPLVLFSGFSTVQTTAAVRAIRAAVPLPQNERLMFAVAVPNALDKPIRMLCDELKGDHEANTGRAER